VQNWLECLVKASEDAAADADATTVAYMTPGCEVQDGTSDAAGAAVGHDRTHVTLLEKPCYSPFQRTSATFFVAFVQYGSQSSTG
jgi:hypothetical protein